MVPVSTYGLMLIYLHNSSPTLKLVNHLSTSETACTSNNKKFKRNDDRMIDRVQCQFRLLGCQNKEAQATSTIDGFASLFKSICEIAGKRTKCVTELYLPIHKSLSFAKYNRCAPSMYLTLLVSGILIAKCLCDVMCNLRGILYYSLRSTLLFASQTTEPLSLFAR